MSNPMGPDEPKLPVPLTEDDLTADGESVAAEEATAVESDVSMVLKQVLDAYLSVQPNYILDYDKI